MSMQRVRAGPWHGSSFSLLPPLFLANSVSIPLRNKGKCQNYMQKWEGIGKVYMQPRSVAAWWGGSHPSLPYGKHLEDAGWLVL